jgi:hypothetical protein
VAADAHFLSAPRRRAIESENHFSPSRALAFSFNTAGNHNPFFSSSSFVLAATIGEDLKGGGREKVWWEENVRFHSHIQELEWNGLEA